MTDQELDDFKCDVAMMLEGFDRGVFVRNINGDDKPGWAVRCLPFVAAMARVHRAIGADHIYDAKRKTADVDALLQGRK